MQRCKANFPKNRNRTQTKVLPRCTIRYGTCCSTAAPNQHSANWRLSPFVYNEFMRAFQNDVEVEDWALLSAKTNNVEGSGLYHDSGARKLPHAHQTSFLKSKLPILVKILSNFAGDLFPSEAAAALQPGTTHIFPVQVPSHTDKCNCGMRYVLLNTLSLHRAPG